MLFLNLGCIETGDTAYITPYQDEQEITAVQVTHGIMEDMYVSEHNDPQIDVEFKPEPGNLWNDYTVMHAKFDDNLVAGNVEFDTYNVNKLRLKRKKSSDYVWNTIYERELTSVNDFDVHYDDFYACANTQYDYAVVTVNSINDVEEEKIYVTTSVYSYFDGIGIADKDHMFYTRLEENIVADIMAPSTVVQTLGRQYPYVIHNGENKYYNGTASGVFVEVDKEKCVGKFDEIHTYNQTFNDFLVNGKPKILKDSYGRRWIVGMSAPPTTAMNSHESELVTTINWVEIGDADDDKTMKEMGLI